MVTVINVDHLYSTMPQDPGPREPPYYECIECAKRVRSIESGRLCPDCGGYLKNIGVPRQQ